MCPFLLHLWVNKKMQPIRVIFHSKHPVCKNTFLIYIFCILKVYGIIDVAMDTKVNVKKWGKTPMIAVAISDRDVELVKADVLPVIDVIELRVDMFKDLSSSYVENIFKVAKKRFSKPLLGTIRCLKEGGNKFIPENTRYELFKTIVPVADIIDVEFQSTIYKKVIRLSHSMKKPVIASYHDLKQTPDDTALLKLLMQAKTGSPDIIKLALKAKTRNDVARLLCFTIKHRDEHLITISLGEKGKISRFINPLFGSMLTYGYISSPKAEGQLHVKQLADQLKMWMI